MLTRSFIAGAGFIRLPARVRAGDRVTVALSVVFLLSVSFYLWTTGSAVPLDLHDGLGDRYNLLATAFLHFHLSAGPAPAALVHLANPYDPSQVAALPNGAMPSGIGDASRLNDDAMYNGQLYFIWGPAPALVLLVPLHLLGFEPSPSFTVAFYAIAGLGFALATLRVLIRQIGRDIPIWTCMLAGFALALSSVVPFLLREPTITTDTLAGGYGFTMAGVWLAASAVASQKASTTRMVLMSLCFGLAANSRPSLWLTALILIPVYLSLRSSRSSRMLLTCLVLPVGICFALFLGYNQARFHNPLEIGSHYQITGYESRNAPIGRLSYVLPGVGFYAFTPPRLRVIFPFIVLTVPRAMPPVGLGGGPEATGGVLPMTPIVVYIVALPWIWRRRPALLGTLAPLFLFLAGIGLTIPMIAAYELFSSTERYETDFTTLLLLASVAAWLSLSKGTGHRPRLLRMGGGLLAVWGCITGLAVSFLGVVSSLAVTHPGTWRTFEDISAPVSTAIAFVVGHPVVAEISAAHLGGEPASLGPQFSEFILSPIEHAGLIIVSPNAGRAALVARVEVLPGARYNVRINGPGRVSSSSPLPAAGGQVDIPVTLNRGLNRLSLHLVATSVHEPAPTTQVVLLGGLSVTRAK